MEDQNIEIAAGG
jgi:hypothetical protein